MICCPWHNCPFNEWCLHSHQAWLWTKCQWPEGVWLRVFLIAVFCYILPTAMTKKLRKYVDGRYIPCRFGGRKEINVVNLLPGLYNVKIANNCKCKLKKSWDGRSLDYLFPEQIFSCWRIENYCNPNPHATQEFLSLFFSTSTSSTRSRREMLETKSSQEASCETKPTERMKHHDLIICDPRY